VSGTRVSIKVHARGVCGHTFLSRTRTGVDMTSMILINLWDHKTLQAEDGIDLLL
jgi:hypothetical protein